MPKLRKPASVRGAKSKAVRVTSKIGGRKTKTGAHEMSNENLLKALADGKRPRDKNKLNAVARVRGISLAVATEPTAEAE